jgi:putative two-component system response regulator
MEPGWKMGETGQKKVVLVDDDYANLVSGKNLLKDRYVVFTVPSGKKLFELLEHEVPDIILLDVEMPNMDGYAVVRELKKNPATSGIPVIFLTGRQDPHSEYKGLAFGAVDYIRKPFAPPLLFKRLENHLASEMQRQQLQDYGRSLTQMVNEQTTTILELQNAILSVLARIVEYRDDETGAHVLRTQRYLRILIEGLTARNFYCDEISTWDIRLVLLSSQLHDIGKVAVPDTILLKPEKLTPVEFDVIKSHTVIGNEIIAGIEGELRANQFIHYAGIMALSHHEKWDGTGYPHYLQGAAIPLLGRCMAIVDVYDALVSIRPYKQSISHKEAMNIIAEGKGNHFDPVLVEVFLDAANQVYAETKLADHYHTKKNF